MSKKFVRNITDTILQGDNKEPLGTNIQNDILSDDEHIYIRNRDDYHCLTDNIKEIKSTNDLATIKKNENNATITIKETLLKSENEHLTIKKINSNEYLFNINRLASSEQLEETEKELNDLIQSIDTTVILKSNSKEIEIKETETNHFEIVFNKGDLAKQQDIDRLERRLNGITIPEQPDTPTIIENKIKLSSQSNELVIEENEKNNYTFSLNGLATVSQFNELSQQIEDLELPEIPDLEPYALKTEIPDLEPYALKTEIPDLEPYALKSEIPDNIDLSLYAKKSEIPNVSNFVTNSNLISQMIEFKNNQGLITSEDIEFKYKYVNRSVGGYYIKLPNGLMIAFNTLNSIKMTVTKPWGSEFYSTENFYWGFPEQFVERPAYFCFPASKDFKIISGLHVSDYNRNQRTDNMYILRPTKAENIVIDVHCFAIGKWKR